MDSGRKGLVRIGEGKMDADQDNRGMDIGPESDVWVFSRPLSVAKGFTKRISGGKTAISHLGLLVTTLKVEEMNRILQQHHDKPASITSDEDMGAMWELCRDSENKNYARVTRTFKAKMLSEEWKCCRGKLAGKTTMTSRGIDLAGSSFKLHSLIPLALCVVKDHPDYLLIENNCQNFVKYLLKAIVEDGKYSPLSIKDIADWFRGVDLSTLSGHYIRSRRHSSATVRSPHTNSDESDVPGKTPEESASLRERLTTGETVLSFPSALPTPRNRNFDTDSDTTDDEGLSESSSDWQDVRSPTESISDSRHDCTIHKKFTSLSKSHFDLFICMSFFHCV